MAYFRGNMSKWVALSSGQTITGAVVGGHEKSGEPIYVARAYHRGALIPGKFIISHGGAYVSWGGQEYKKKEYQVLIGRFSWLPAHGSNIPPGAFRSGSSETGEPLFVGRVHHEGSITTGKVQQSHGCCYIPYNGQEIRANDYEVLTH